MSVQILAAAAPQAAISTQGLVTYLQSLFGPLFLGIVGIVALFFLFTREITRFVQFIVLAVAIAATALAWRGADQRAARGCAGARGAARDPGAIRAACGSARPVCLHHPVRADLVTLGWPSDPGRDVL